MNIVKINPTLEAANALSEVAMSAYPPPYRYLWEYGDTSWYVTKCFLPEVFFRELNDSNSAFYLIEAEGQNVGFLKLKLHAAYKDYRVEDTLELERIYLLSEASGKGYGKAVIDFVEKTALAYAKKQIILKAMDSSEAAIRFYQRNGFAIFDTYTLSYERIRVEYRGMFVMVKKL